MPVIDKLLSLIRQRETLKDVKIVLPHGTKLKVGEASAFDLDRFSSKP